MKITIAQYSFLISEPFVEGHPLSRDEARALNQLRAEHIRNHFSPKIRLAASNYHSKLLPPDTLSQFQSDISQYDSEYQFGPRKRAPKISALDIEIEMVARYWADSEAIRAGRIGATDDEISKWKSKPQVQIEARRRLEIQKQITAENAI